MAFENLVALGIVLLIAGTIFIIFGSLSNEQKGQTKFGIGGFIFFIPFGFANDKPLLYVVMAVAVILFVVSLLFSQKII